MATTISKLGVTWASSRNGELNIAVGQDSEFLGRPQVEVWAMHAGSHDLAPLTRRFYGPARVQDARDYANTLWRNY